MTEQHEPTPDLIALAESMFTEATEAHVSEEDNRDSIHDTWSALLREAIGSGEVRIVGRDMVKMTDAYLWQVINQRAARRAQMYLKALALGQFALPGIDEALDEVITVGKGRRSTMRHLNRDDLRRMLTERQDNLAKQQAALAEFRDEVVGVIDGWLAQFGSIPAAIAAGAVDLHDEATA